jgi:hypothetical protein
MTGEGGSVKYLGGFDIKKILTESQEASLSSEAASGIEKSLQVISPTKVSHSGVSSKRLLEAAEQTAEAVAGGTKNSRALRATAAAASIIRRRL